MSSNKLIPLFIGTCRTHDPVQFIRKQGLQAQILPERYHSPQQILRAVKFLTRNYNYPLNELHTVSDLTIEKILKGNNSLHDINQDLEEQRDRWDRATHIVIEISTRKEFYYTRKDRHKYVNTFFKRDIVEYKAELTPFYEKNLLSNISSEEVESSNTSEARITTAMNQIKQLAKDKKILWVSHITPNNYSEELNYLIEQRKTLAKTQQVISNKIGDRFFDPSIVAKELGDSLFFKDNGKDINHMTDMGAEMLSRYYLEILSNY